ncbi:MAG: purine-nucleoside phosphorylase [Pseudomonadota bacterium]
MEYSSYFQEVEKSVKWFEKRIFSNPEVLLVLSGGLDEFLNLLEDRITIQSEDIPNFPKSCAEGHKGSIHFGKYKGVNLALMQGRYHYYEGHSPQAVVFPYFVFHGLGIKTLISTNAVGGIRKDLAPGDIMMITDHINMMGINPLIGIAVKRDENQFTSMIDAYDPLLRKLALSAAKKEGIDLKEGVYLATSGPSYETPSEIKVFRMMGADTVGMSTVPSVIACRFLGVRVLSFCCIANKSADLHEGQMQHSKVLQAVNQMSPKVVKLLLKLIPEIGEKRM